MSINNQLACFSSEEFGALEILMIDGKPYFPATECAAALGYKNPHKAVIDHCRWLTKREVPHPQNPKKIMTRNFVPEGDLYRLIVRSKLPAAARFESWIFDEVVPQIRNFGAYTPHKALLAEFEYLTDFVAELLPKANYHDAVLQCPRAVQASIIAKDYGISAVTFNRLLHYLGIQYKIGGTWLLYQGYCGRGYTLSRTYCLPDGSAAVHTYWTQRGRAFLYRKLKEAGIVPMSEIERITEDN